MIKRVVTEEPAPPHRRMSPWLFLFLTLGWSWSLYGIIYLTRRNWLEFPVVFLTAAAGTGPLIVSVFLTALGRRDFRRDSSAGAFLRRCLDPRPLPLRWYGIILGLIALLVLLPVLLHKETLLKEGLFSSGSLLFLLIGIIFGALEEVGWRGYAQEALQRRIPVVLAGLIIGVFWALWHLPLFFLSGTYQSTLGVGTPAFRAFFIALVAGSPFYGWLYNTCGRVVFAPVLYHSVSNALRELVPTVPALYEVGVEAAMFLVVLIVSWKWMSRKVAVQKNHFFDPGSTGKT